MRSVQKKSYKINLCPKPITRKTSISPKAKLLPLNLTVYLLDFFTFEELVKFCNANVHFYNAFVTILKKTKMQLSYLSKIFNFKYSPEKNLSSYHEMNTEQKGLYFQIDDGQIKYYSLANYFGWAWKDDTRYWTAKNINNAVIEGPTPYLNTVCYLDTHFHFENVLAGTYQLYIYHFTTNQISLTLTVKVGDKNVYHKKFPTDDMLDECKAFEKTWEKETNANEENEDKKKQQGSDNEDEDEDNEYINQYFNSNHHQNNKDLRLYKQFICDFTITENDIKKINEGLKVTVEFRHTTDWWKNDWLIHGGVLERTDIKVILE